MKHTLKNPYNKTNQIYQTKATQLSLPKQNIPTKPTNKTYYTKHIKATYQTKPAKPDQQNQT